MNHLEQETLRLNQEVADFQETLPHRYQERTLLSSANLFCGARISGIGTAFFLGSTSRAITAHHVLSANYPNGGKVNGIIHRRQADGRFANEEIQFDILRTSSRFDIAVLQLIQTTADAFLEMPGVNYDFQKKRMAITSFHNSLHEQAPVEVPRTFCVIPAECLKSSEHHIVYMSNLFSGDSGGAVLFSHDGVVRAMHQETVNQAREELGRGSFDEEEVVKSINSLVSCLSQGFIGLRLDVVEIQQLITN